MYAETDSSTSDQVCPLSATPFVSSWQLLALNAPKNEYRTAYQNPVAGCHSQDEAWVTHESVSSAFTDGRTFADLIADLDSGRVHPLKDEQICALQKRVPDSIPKSCGRNHLASTNALGHL